jgi:hypothetical protein
VLSREEYLAAWSRWHGGTGTESGLVRGWLSVAYALARPLAGLPPVVATALGLVVAAAAVVPTEAGGWWLVAAGLLVGLSGLVDSLDGALAIGTGRAAIKAQYGVPEELRSCHTAIVGEYAFEGHVPFAHVARLLRERPDGILGLAVAGMPAGSPGMEVPGGESEPFEVMAFGKGMAPARFTA